MTPGIKLALVQFFLNAAGSALGVWLAYLLVARRR